MLKNRLGLTLAIVLCANLLLAQSAPSKPTDAPKAAAPVSSSLPSKETVESFLKRMFGYDSNIKMEVLSINPAVDPSMADVAVRFTTPDGPQVSHLFVSPNQKFIISGDIAPFGADPFATTRQLLKEKATGPWRGPANPSVTIVEFGDLQCPACKHAYPILEELMQQLPNAKFIFQQFPLMDVHPWAFEAAKYAECVAQQNNSAFWKFADLVYDHQDAMQSMTPEEVEPRLKDYAGEAGVNADMAATCTADAKIAAKIYASMDLAKTLEVNATPTIFIGGRKISGGTPIEALKDMADFQASDSK